MGEVGLFFMRVQQPLRNTSGANGLKPLRHKDFRTFWAEKDLTVSHLFHKSHLTVSHLFHLFHKSHLTVSHLLHKSHLTVSHLFHKSHMSHKSHLFHKSW